jgi:hypothetical protein
VGKEEPGRKVFLKEFNGRVSPPLARLTAKLSEFGSILDWFELCPRSSHFFSFDFNVFDFSKILARLNKTIILIPKRIMKPQF